MARISKLRIVAFTTIIALIFAPRISLDLPTAWAFVKINPKLFKKGHVSLFVFLGSH